MEGIAFYPIRKFIILKDEIKTHFFLNNDTKKCFESAEHVIYEYNKNNINLKIYGDSLLFITDKQYKFTERLDGENRLIKLANIILACLFNTSSNYLNIKNGDTSFFIHDKEVTIQNIFHCSTDNRERIKIESGGSQISINDFIQRGNLEVFRDNNITSSVHNYEDIKDFFVIFEELLDEIIAKNIENTIFMLYRSILETKKGNFDISIVLSFFVIEEIIDSMWKDILKDKKLYKKLKDDTNYTVSIKSNMLYMNGIISKEELEKIDFARKKRNVIVHDNNKFQDTSNFIEIFELTDKVFSCATMLYEKYFKMKINMYLYFGG